MHETNHFLDFLQHVHSTHWQSASVTPSFFAGDLKSMFSDRPWSLWFPFFCSFCSVRLTDLFSAFLLYCLSFNAHSLCLSFFPSLSLPHLREWCYFFLLVISIHFLITSSFSFFLPDFLSLIAPNSPSFYLSDNHLISSLSLYPSLSQFVCCLSLYPTCIQ